MNCLMGRSLIRVTTIPPLNLQNCREAASLHGGPCLKPDMRLEALGMENAFPRRCAEC